MKSKLLFIALAFVAAFSFSACSDDDDDNNNNGGGDDGKESTITVKYVVDDPGLSPIFNVNIGYKDENGKNVTLDSQALPWEKSITVKTPFTATLSITYALKADVEIPDIVTVGQSFGILSGGIPSKVVESSMSIKKEQLDAWLERRGTTSTECEFE